MKRGGGAASHEGVCVRVCVRVRERERERETKRKRVGGIFFFSETSFFSFFSPFFLQHENLLAFREGAGALSLFVSSLAATMVLVDQVPSYSSAASLPPPPPAIATAVLGVPTTATTSSSLGGGGSGGGGNFAAATGIPAAPSTNRTAFLGAHLGVRASPLEAFVSTDPSDYAYGTESLRSFRCCRLF